MAQQAGDYNANINVSGTPPTPGQSQEEIIRTILRVGQSMGADQKMLLAALETGFVESGMRNLNYGDRDSKGVFQQRPSQGWGTVDQVMDIEHAARQFFSRAAKSPFRTKGTAGQLAQDVQRSAFPDRYDKHQSRVQETLRGMGVEFAGPPGGVTQGTKKSRAGRGAAGSGVTGNDTGGGGGGGGGAVVDTTPKLAPGASQADALAFIREHYGYGAWIFDQPAVAKILRDAATDGHWSDARLTGALMGTDFFKKNTGTTIAWMNTESNDPATAKAQVDAEVNNVMAKAQTIGMDITPERARQIATDSKRFGWDDTQLQKAVGHEYHYNPTMAQKGVAKQIRDSAALYGIPMTDGGLDEWGRKVASGDATADDFKTTMINQAKSLFPTLAAELDRGATVKDIFDPYAAQASKVLGVDPSTIDILDPKWQRPLMSTDGKSPTRMSTFDWQKTLRTDATYGFDTTDNARQEAADFAHRIRAGFGLA